MVSTSHLRFLGKLLSASAALEKVVRLMEVPGRVETRWTELSPECLCERKRTQRKTDEADYASTREHFYDRRRRCCWKDTSQWGFQRPTPHHTLEGQGRHLGIALRKGLSASGLGSGIFLPPVSPESLIEAPISLFRARNSWSTREQEEERKFHCHFSAWMKVLDRLPSTEAFRARIHFFSQTIDVTFQIPDQFC